MEFLRHAVPLPDGRCTRADVTQIGETGHFRSLARLLNFAFSGREPEKIRICDLGCYEGGYTLELARLGYQALGIEGRAVNFATCRWLADQWRLPNLSYVHDDVRNLRVYAPFDAVYASGLLYHLDAPTAFISLLGDVCSRLLVINTHLAEETVRPRFRGKLSALTRHEGMEGRWYEESSDDPSADDATLRRSAVGNRRSFWLTRASLFAALRAAGFDLLFEQMDGHYDFIRGLAAGRRNQRGIFVAIRS